LSLCIN